MPRPSEMMRLSLEETAPPAKNKQSLETEIVLYALIGKPEGLQECTRWEDHHQLEVRFTTGHSSRVRKVTLDGHDSYFFTFKVKQDAHDGGELIEANIEETTEVDKDFFDNFRKVAERELIKRRYIFNSTNVMLTVSGDDNSSQVELPNVEYEVDVYTKADGQASEWCKIDVEVDNVLDFMGQHYKDISKIKVNMKVSHLAFAPTNILMAQTDDEDARAQIDKLWDDFARPLNKTTE